MDQTEVTFTHKQKSYKTNENKTGCHAWSCTVHTYQQLTCWFGKTFNCGKSICKRVGKNTIKCSRQPFWYFLFANASCRKSAMNLHQFMSSRLSASPARHKSQDKKLPHQHSNESIKKLAVTSFQMTSESKDWRKKGVEIEHSPGWGSICCLSEEMW